ncbi:MAG: chloride channel protein, partial [Myxococcaceae bacterium]
FLTTLSHILLQIITVGMGSPLGREVAPRELAALVAAGLSSKLGLDPKETKILLACGAGAGLAAVYNVPLAGAVFVLEVLLCEFSIALLLRALVISGIAVAISWIGLGNHPAYEIPNLEISYSLVAWSVIAGPILGFSGYWFMRLATFARSKARSNWQTPVLCLLNFSLLGLLAIYFPALLGNGKSSALLVFDNTIGIGLTASLLVLRVLMTCLTLRAGAHGGLLTPSLANGALFSFLLGSLWSFFWPGTNLNTYAIVGAAAFLASAQKMPITALILIFEFTRVNPSFLLPVALCILGASFTSKILAR